MESGQLMLKIAFLFWERDFLLKLVFRDFS